MQLIALSVLVSSLLAVSVAAPANDQPHVLVPRQTYTITCIGENCENDPKPTPTSSEKPEPPKSSLKVSLFKHVTPTTTQGEEVGPSSTRCPVPLYYKCGGWHDGKPWSGCTVCEKGSKCVVQNEWYFQCVKDE
ncbi:hypothetical protein GQ44DRAFT_606503 [Phaeosphaeriaceae sp. PMI808]|nr:hypothetical protein GQ44DRAFT_606503 [Phaeosphaeriaceae sp. PMI808]